MLALAARSALGQVGDVPAIEASPAVAVRVHWIQFNMVSGRIAATSSLSVQKMLVQSGRRSNRRESLAIEINAGICGMEYHADADDDQLQIKVEGGNQVSVRRTRPGNHYLLKFDQQPDQPLSMSLEQGDVKRQWEADGFWQLYLAEPDVMRVHLVPLLELLHPSWQLSATAAEVEDALVRTRDAIVRNEPDRKRWSRLVDELGSPKFAEREGAQRELYKAGQAVVPYLQSLNRSRLDAEQVARIGAIMESLSIDYEDHVQRVAAWLANDERVWLSLMTRDDVARRRIAVEQLGRLLGHDVEFQPEAPLETRRQQIDRLRQRLQLAADSRPGEE